MRCSPRNEPISGNYVPTFSIDKSSSTIRHLDVLQGALCTSYNTTKILKFIQLWAYMANANWTSGCYTYDNKYLPVLITNSLHFSGTVWSGTTSLSPTGKSDILKVVFSFWKFSIRFCNHFWNINVNNYMNCRRELNVSESGLFSLRLTEIFLNNNWLFLRWPRRPLPIPKILALFQMNIKHDL